jgi:hypothetical protein
MELNSDYIHDGIEQEEEEVGEKEQRRIDP